MIWIIVIAAILAAIATLFTVQRMKVLKSKEELEQTIESVISSFEDLMRKAKESDLDEQEKSIVVANIERNVQQLNRWKNQSLPNVTFWKNHTAPIEKEFNDLKENVASELARYEDLPTPQIPQ
jgi:molybdopterin converting factor small subunit